MPQQQSAERPPKHAVSAWSLCRQRSAPQTPQYAALLYSPRIKVTIVGKQRPRLLIRVSRFGQYQRKTHNDS
jgi:hypothetical protein